MYRVARILVVSNAVFIDDLGTTHSGLIPKRGHLVVGMLANLSIEKGIFEFLALASQATRTFPGLRFVLAGPFETDALRDECLETIAQLPNIEYWGPLESTSKEHFYREIDVFLLPTSYRNEAEPLVILEALSGGNPVIAFRRGCIPDLVRDCGIDVPITTDFVRVTFEALRRWSVCPLEYQRLSREAKRRYAEIKQLAIVEREQLLDMMASVADQAGL